MDSFQFPVSSFQFGGIANRERKLLSNRAERDHKPQTFAAVSHIQSKERRPRTVQSDATAD
jgi:hypothetical protein